MKTIHSEKAKLIGSVIIFGTIGLFRRYIPYSSGTIALFRAIIGVIYLLLFQLFRKKQINRLAMKKNFWLLIASGLAISANWILLFEAYRFTTVAAATVCYYMAPIFVIALTPVFSHERLRFKQVICILVALIGIIFVSGAAETGLSGLKGIILGLCAAVGYSICILLNKQMKLINGMDRTIAQLGICAVVLTPYVLFFESPVQASFAPLPVTMLLVVGVIHTGIAYELYFDSMQTVPAQTVAILSYVDPIVAILLSALVLQENMTELTWVGVVLVLGATIASEISFKKKKSVC